MDCQIIYYINGPKGQGANRFTVLIWTLFEIILFYHTFISKYMLGWLGQCLFLFICLLVQLQPLKTVVLVSVLSYASEGNEKGHKKICPATCRMC